MATTKFTPDGTANASLEAVITGTGKAIPLGDCRQVSWFTSYTVAPTVGTLLIEHNSVSPSYAGTWTLLDTINCANLSAGTEGSGSFPGPVAFGRARLTVNTDQAITVYLNGLLN